MKCSTLLNYGLKSWNGCCLVRINKHIITPRRMNVERNNFGVCFLTFGGEDERPSREGGAACRPRGRSLKFFTQAGVATLFQAHASWTRALNRILRGTPGCFCQMTRRWIIHLARIHSDDAAGRRIVIPRLPIKPRPTPPCFPSFRNLSWLIVSPF